MVIIMALPLSYPIYKLLILHIADIDTSYGAYVDDEYFDNHDYDDTDYDSDDDNDHKQDSYTAAGVAPTQTRPGHAGPRRAARPQKYFMFSLFWHEWVSDRSGEALDPPKCRFLRALSIWMGPRADL